MEKSRSFVVSNHAVKRMQERFSQKLSAPSRHTASACVKNMTEMLSTAHHLLDWKSNPFYVTSMSTRFGNGTEIFKAGGVYFICMADGVCAEQVETYTVVTVVPSVLFYPRENSLALPTAGGARYVNKTEFFDRMHERALVWNKRIDAKIAKKNAKRVEEERVRLHEKKMALTNNPYTQMVLMQHALLDFDPLSTTSVLRLEGYYKQWKNHAALVDLPIAVRKQFFELFLQKALNVLPHCGTNVKKVKDFCSTIRNQLAQANALLKLMPCSNSSETEIPLFVNDKQGLAGFVADTAVFQPVGSTALEQMESWLFAFNEATHNVLKNEQTPEDIFVQGQKLFSTIKDYMEAGPIVVSDEKKQLFLERLEHEVEQCVKNKEECIQQKNGPTASVRWEAFLTHLKEQLEAFRPLSKKTSVCLNSAFFQWKRDRRSECIPQQLDVLRLLFAKSENACSLSAVSRQQLRSDVRKEIQHLMGLTAS